MITIATMRAAGVSEMLILKVLEIEQTERFAARREQNRINKQNQRLRQQLNADSQHVSADRDDIADKKEIPPIPPKEKTLPSESLKEDSSVSVRASRFKLEAIVPEWRDWSASQGMIASEIDGQFARFSDYWKAKGGKDSRKINWLATWRNWCRTFLETHPRPAAPVKSLLQIMTEAERERRKREQESTAEALRGPTNGSGAESPNSHDGSLFSEGYALRKTDESGY